MTVADTGRTVPGHDDDGAPTDCVEGDCVAAVSRGDRWISAFASVEAGGRAHFHHRDELHARVRTARADYFTRLAATYDAHPGDFIAAWAYLQHHPIFHRPSWPHGRGRTISDLTEQELAAPPPFVNDEDGLRHLWVHVAREDDGTAVIHLEHGPHLWPENIPPQSHWHTPADGLSSHDLRLNVTEDSYEAAIVTLARRVRVFYGHDRSKV